MRLDGGIARLCGRHHSDANQRAVSGEHRIRASASSIIHNPHQLLGDPDGDILRLWRDESRQLLALRHGPITH